MIPVAALEKLEPMQCFEISRRTEKKVPFHLYYQERSKMVRPLCDVVFDSWFWGRLDVSPSYALRDLRGL